MIKKYILLMCISLGVVLSCTEEKEMTFDVNVEYNNYYVNEPVKFLFDGDADIISFYSGELGHDYSHKDEARIYKGKAYLSFTSAFAAGMQAQEQADEEHEKKVLTIWYSTDFSGDYSKSGVESATWHDITDYFIFPTSTISNAKDQVKATSSGKVALSDFMPEEDMAKPVYFAFRYKVDAYDAELGNTRPHACIRNFTIETESDETTVKRANALFATMKWQNINYGYDEDAANDNPYFKPSTDGGYLWFSTWSAADNAGWPSVEHISWAVSNPVDVTPEINIGCDMSVGIKKYSEGPMRTYTHTYGKTGTYEAVFSAVNVGEDGVDQNVVRKVTINIIDEAGAGIEQPDDIEWK